MKKLVIAAILAGTIATPALAQPVVGGPFGGLRVEGIIGFDSADPVGPREGGAVYGAGAGFDVQSGGMVFGAGAELSGSTVSGCVGIPTAPPGNATLCSNLGRDIAVTGRVGALVGPDALVYATAGYTNLRLTNEQTGGGVAPLAAGENLDGLRVGAGAEYAIGPNSFLKGEYRYSTYGGDLDRHQVVAGFGFRF